MAYRHEWKHIISPADLLVLRQRLPLLMEWDPHATGGEYLVRSLYFDNAADTISGAFSKYAQCRIYG